MKLLYKLLMAPVTESSTGGGGTAVAEPPGKPKLPEFDRTSHVDAIKDLFTKKTEGEPEAISNEPPQKPETKPAEKPKEKPAAPVDPKKPKSLIDQFDAGTETPPEVDPAPNATEPAKVELPEDKLQLGKEAKGETSRIFNEMKTITKTVRAEVAAKDVEIAELKKKISTAPSASSAPDPEIERIKAEHKAALDNLAVVDLQKHPAFQRDFVIPRVELTASIAEALSINGVTDFDIGSWAEKPRAEFGKAINEIAAKLGDFDRSEFVASARKLYDINAKAKVALSNSGELSKQLQAKAQAEQKAEFQSVVRALGDAGGVLAGHDIPSHATGEGLAQLQAYNDSVKSVPQVAEDILFGTKSNKELSGVAMEAAMYRHMQKHSIPVIQKMYGKLLEITKAQSAELERLKGSKRAASEVGSTTTRDSKVKELHEMNPAEALAALGRRH